MPVCIGVKYIIDFFASQKKPRCVLANLALNPPAELGGFATLSAICELSPQM